MAENPEPKFYVQGVTLVQKPQLLKDLHVKCMVFADGIVKPLIFFNRPDIYTLLLDKGEEPFDVVVQITENHWRSRVNIELLGLDIV